MTPGGSSAPCGRGEARFRLDEAREYLALAESAAVTQRGPAWTNAAVGNAVLAGIAAADAICCARLGRRSRGQDHRQARSILADATGSSGNPVVADLDRLVGLKSEAHYGSAALASSKVTTSLKQARRLVERAATELA